MSNRSPAMGAADPIDLFAGKRLRQFRRLRRLSLAELGHSVGLTYQQVQKYESGANRISASKLWHLASVLGVDVCAFFPDIDEKIGSDPDVVVYAAAIKRLDAEVRSEVIHLIDAISAMPSLRSARR